jgi:hypothetical protein
MPIVKSPETRRKSRFYRGAAFLIKTRFRKEPAKTRPMQAPDGPAVVFSATPLATAG